MKKSIYFLLFSLCTLSLWSQSDGANLWIDIEEGAIQSFTADRWIIPQKYRTLQLDKSAFEVILNQSPNQNNFSGNTLTIDIPLPNGRNQQFSVVTSSIMDPKLAVKFPNIKTYSGKGIDDPSASIFLDMTPAGFHAMILSPAGAVFIDPYYKDNDNYYVAYYRQNFKSEEAADWSCEVRKSYDLPQDEMPTKDQELKIGTARMETIKMRTHRIAIAANGEYTAFHGGTVAGGLAAVNTTLNRVRGVYETELGVSFMLVANNDQVIYTDASTDPYSNTSAAFSQNTSNLNAVIGSANYDVGHVFTTGSGGIAGLGVICSSGKGRGTTGLTNPTGDPFHIDYVAHEIGHQYGGNHTFNGDSGSCSGGNRNGSTAYEPGSGSTIQAYAGICGNDNLQTNSDPYFHLISLMEMRTHVTTGSGGTCGTEGTTTNTTPTANANVEGIDGKMIPASTSFELTGAATDLDNDNLTYNWEEWDLGPQSDVNAPGNNAPLFRTFEPTNNPTRTFPKLSDILSNTTSVGEVLPTTDRTLRFQFIARDDNSIGGYDSDMITLNVVDNTGPFKITTPNAAGTFSGTIAVVWDPAGTNASPINCSEVDIYLSTDGGQTFPELLADNVTNNGAGNVTLPNINVSMARLKIKCADNVFFDITDTNFTIQPSGNDPCAITDLVAGTTSPCNSLNDKYTQTVIVTYNDAPTSGDLVVNNQNFAITTSPQTITLTNLPADGDMVNVTANFSNNFGCSRTESNLFQAPESCAPACAIAAITTGNQSSCNSANNTYTQDLTVTYSNPPNSGNLVVNNQSFSITSSPQIITLTNLAADGNSVTVTASFSDNSACTFTAPNLYSAPNPCVSELCQEHESADTPIAISAVGTPTINSTINVSQAGIITDVKIKNLKGTHDYVSDLEFSITSPTGTTLILFSKQCGSTVDFDMNLDDDGTHNACPLTGGNTYSPLGGNLSVFNEENASGNWILTVTDFYNTDGGSLEGWALEICSEVDPNSITNLSLNQTPILEGTYVSCGIITATGTIATNTTVTFKAETSITLNAGFSVASGSTFNGQIENCETSSKEEVMASQRNKDYWGTEPTNKKNKEIISNLQIFPNPVKNVTQIAYKLAVDSDLTINLVNMNGKLMKRVVAPVFQTAGAYQIPLAVNDLVAGIYFLYFQNNETIITKKLVIHR